jgi:hypothetical protein
MSEAVAQLRKGLESVPNISNGTARGERELDLQIELGNALIAKAWSASERGDTIARARQLCEQLNRSDLLGPILLAQNGFCQVRAELEQAANHADEMFQLGERQKDTTWEYFGSVQSADSDESGHVFRFEAGHHSETKPDRIPI